MVHYLAYMAARADFAYFRNSLPVLGKDGTLSDDEKNSPAVGHIFAKTGTYIEPDFLNNNMMLRGKGLAGYTTTSSGEHIAIAIYANNVPLTAAIDDPVNVLADAIKAGDALDEIAVAANLLPIEPAK